MTRAADLAKWVQTKVGLPYVYAACGEIMTAAMIDRFSRDYPGMYTVAYKAKCMKAVGKQAFDCVNLIKFFAWGERSGPPAGSPVPDTNADGAYSISVTSAIWSAVKKYLITQKRFTTRTLGICRNYFPPHFPPPIPTFTYKKQHVRGVAEENRKAHIHCGCKLFCGSEDGSIIRRVHIEYVF